MRRQGRRQPLGSRVRQDASRKRARRLVRRVLGREAWSGVELVLALACALSGASLAALGTVLLLRGRASEPSPDMTHGSSLGMPAPPTARPVGAGGQPNGVVGDALDAALATWTRQLGDRLGSLTDERDRAELAVQIGRSGGPAAAWVLLDAGRRGLVSDVVVCESLAMAGAPAGALVGAAVHDADPTVRALATRFVQASVRATEGSERTMQPPSSMRPIVRPSPFSQLPASPAHEPLARS